MIFHDLLVHNCRGKVRAINEGAVPDDSELGYCACEAALPQLLVVDHALPIAGSARVAGESEVGMQVHLTRAANRRVHLSAVGVVHTKRNTSTLEKDLKEDLGVRGDVRVTSIVSVAAQEIMQQASLSVASVMLIFCFTSRLNLHGPHLSAHKSRRARRSRSVSRKVATSALSVARWTISVS